MDDHDNPLDIEHTLTVCLPTSVYVFLPFSFYSFLLLLTLLIGRLAVAPFFITHVCVTPYLASITVQRNLSDSC